MTLVLCLPVFYRSRQVLDRSSTSELPVCVPAEHERVRGGSGQSGVSHGSAEIRDRPAVQHAREPRWQTQGLAALVSLGPRQSFLLRSRVLRGTIVRVLLVGVQYIVGPIDGLNAKNCIFALSNFYFIVQSFEVWTWCFGYVVRWMTVMLPAYF